MPSVKAKLLASLLCGLSIFVILNLAAWWNLRGEMYVCGRQSGTRLRMAFLAKDIQEYIEKTGSPPAELADLDDRPPEYLQDLWGRNLLYTRTNNSFELYSLGRDGKPGGIGLDGDLYSDRRNEANTLATFRQYFTETDLHEVNNRNFLSAGAVAGILVAVSGFLESMNTRRHKQPMTRKQLIGNMTVITILVCVVGFFLLPFHIPSGH